MKQSQSTENSRPSSHLIWLALALVIALGYLFGLGGDHIPRNGDELVYAHIARLTAESGNWLPLVSSFDFMRNTKPPFLFWQAMIAGGWGENWSLINLRLPSIFYSWSIALMVGLLTRKIVREQSAPSAASNQQALKMGAIAAIVYLSFFSSYRYGRPYLTSAPETFWLCGVFFAIAWSPVKLLASRWKFPLLAGIAIGIGCLYKSFAMVVPVGFGLALCYQVVGAGKAPWQLLRPGIVTDAIKVLAICVIALALFGLWFAIDPQPGEVWREFVVGENAGKFKSAPGYWHVALGSGGMLVILTGYFSNAGLLLPVSIGMAVAAFKSWRRKTAISPAEKIMWLWLLALALVFMLPNQRSTRYLIAAMPALGVLIALYWSRIGKIWFGLTLVLCVIGLLVMGLIGYGAVTATGMQDIYSPLFWLYLLAVLLACLLGMVRTNLTRSIGTLASFAILFSLAWASAPFNGEIGKFKPETISLLRGQVVQVPSNFNGHFERYQFMLPGAKITPYFAAQPVDFEPVNDLFKISRYALVQRRIGTPPCSDCRIIDTRWDLRSRQDEKDGTMAAFTSPQTYFFAQEYLVESLTQSPTPSPTEPVKP